MAKLSVNWMRRILFSLQQVEQDLLFGVIGAGRITGSRADALVFSFDQVGNAEILLAAKAPSVAASCVRQLGQRFRQPIMASALVMMAL